MRTRRYIPALVALLAVPVAVEAAPNNFSELAQTVITMLNYASGVVVAGVIAVYFFAIAKDFKSLMDGSEMKRKQDLLVWGMIGIFVMVSIWGILRVISNSIFSL